jgi:hypothetical protein
MTFFRCPDCAGQGWILNSVELLDEPLNPYARPDCVTCLGAGTLSEARVREAALRYLAAPKAEPA